MKLSSYIVIQKIKKGYVIFSTISKTIIEVNEDFYKELINIQNLDIDKLKYITEENIDYLKRNYFIVDCDIDEKCIVDYKMNKDRLHQQVFSSYIAFSTLCNFACVYCYEEGQSERKHIMDEETLMHTLNWYEKIITKNNYRELQVCLFGGEPLLHKDLIKEFVSKLSNIVKKHNAELVLTMVTNGYLLDNEIVSFLKDYNLNEIQITIDGPEEIHNQRRPLRAGGPTFQRIIENIKSIDKFNGGFLFRVSFDKSNKDSIKEVLRYIKGLNIKNKYVVYLAPIHNTTNQECNHCSFCCKNVYKDQEETINTYKELYSYMKEIGLNIPKYYTNGPCMLVSNDTVLIDPYGDLYKCVEMISIKNLCVGNVKDKEYNDKYYQFVGRPLYNKCIESECKYVCLCGGGCLMENYVNNKNMEKVNCELKYFEELIPFFLKEKYDE